MEIMIGIAIVLFIVVVAYLLPTLIAFSRKHKNKVPITVVNILFGWMLIGWGVALVWSLTSNVEE